MYTEAWWGNLKERDCLKGVGVDKMILKWIFFSVSRGCGVDLSDPACGPVAGSFERDNFLTS
jgi:hypothetical protein